MTDKKNIEIATFANVCFWCTEAVFQQPEGVEKVTSGYSGGHVANPTYEQVCDKKQVTPKRLKLNTTRQN